MVWTVPYLISEKHYGTLLKIYLKNLKKKK
jgi:hypothetical protein